jgi:phage protein D
VAVATLVHWPQVEVGGSALSPELERVLDHVVVDHHLHLPDMFEIRFLATDPKVLSSAGLEIGKPVKIGVVAPGGQTESLISGEVTSLEAEYGPAGAFAVARGYDPSHRLHGGRRTDTYKNVKDSDIASTIAQKAGLQVGTIDDSGTLHDHVSQFNLSDWDFLKGRAREIGFELSVIDGKFTFRKPIDSSGGPASGDYNSSNPLQLVFGQDLLEFRPRLSAAQQVKDVKARGWDPKQKQKVVGSASASTTSASLSATPSALAGKVGDPSYVVVDRPLFTQAQVDAAAKAGSEAIASTFAEADGVARGDPKLKAGTPVNIAEVIQDFAGQYTLTSTRHVFDHEGYRTHFVVSGRQERSILGLASAGLSNGSASAGGHPVYGMVIGQVSDNNDPDQLGRVKLKLPWLSDDYESDWARVAQLGAGPDSGAVFLPENNDEVLVAFEFGDVRRPYVIGSLWNGVDKPKLGSGLFDNGKVKRRGFVSRKGHRFVFLDDANNAGIALLTSDGNLKIALNESKSEIHISCQGKIMLKAQGDLTIDSQGNIKLTAQQGISLQAQNSLDLQGMTASLKTQSPSLTLDNGAGAKVEMSGPQVNINSGALQVI